MGGKIQRTWNQTFSGHRFDGASIRLEDIDIIDIATSLSRQCRYAGHCIRFYSVAEHCVLMATKAEPEHKLSALMHDASEAYLVDIPKPIKRLLAGYREIEDAIMAAIAKKYGFAWPMPREVADLDVAILSDEREQNLKPMDADPIEWGNVLPAIGVELRCWPPNKAKNAFLEAFYAYRDNQP